MPGIVEMVIWLPGIIIGLTFHEFAHGKVADYLGDDTPYYQGRLTLNPLAHIDWIGFAMLMIFHFGWAKPVMVNPANFRDVGVKRGMMLVSLAGPVTNLLLALVGMFLIKYISPYQQAQWADYTLQLLGPLVWINLILAAFNMIPVPPLDGSKILAGLLPDEGANFMYSMERYSMLILLLLIISGAISVILTPLVQILYGLLSAIVF
ncbi:MAG: site-2 protease family protein [Syntrophomonadaceae bacterium]|jgi:Zn-dependent protease